jgi:hypothetical protein
MTSLRVHAPLRQPAVADVAMVRKADIAAMLCVHVRTFERLLATGKFPEPTAMVNRRPIWRRQLVERWIDSGGTSAS